MNSAAHPQPRHILPPLPPPQQQPQPPRMNGQPHNSIRMPATMPMPNAAIPPFPHGRSPPNIDNTKHVPCKFYPLGSCNAGDACKFSHNLETAQDRQPCKYFQKGNCKFGAKCALLHIIDGRLVNDPLSQTITLPHASGFQRQVVMGAPHVSGLSMGMQQLGPNQPPPTAMHQNGYHTTQQQQQQQQQSYFPPTSPTVTETHFNLSSKHNSPPSPQKFRSGLSSALRNHDPDSEVQKSAATSFNLLGPLDAPFPASVDLNNNQIARHGPFAASVPSRFGLYSGISSISGSIRERVVTGDYPGSGTQSPIHGEFGSRYGSPTESIPWPHDSHRSGTLLQSIQQQRNPQQPSSPLHSRPQSSSSPFGPIEQKPAASSRLTQFNRPRIPPISSSVPAAHFGEKLLLSPTQIGEDEEALDPDALPSSLHDEVLLPQEINRRSSQTHTPGSKRRSSIYEDYIARSPPSGAVTPGSERGGGGGSLSGSPGSSRMEPIWSKISSSTPEDPRNGADIPEFSSLSLSSRQRVTSPLRNPLDPSTANTQYVRTSSARRIPSSDQLSHNFPLKTPSVHAAQKWGGRTAEKLFAHQSGAVNGGTSSSNESQAVNVPGVTWRRTSEFIGTTRDPLTYEEVRRIREEEEGTQFSMDES